MKEDTFNLEGSTASAPSKRKPAANSRRVNSKSNATSTTRVAKAPRPAHALLIEAKLDKEHWGKRIIAAERLGKFTPNDTEDARSWTTCACGKQDKRIPRFKFDDLPAWAKPKAGGPIDVPLYEWGMAFSRDVFLDHFCAAVRSLIAIETRAKIVLAETLAVKK